jgi:hypothetical protein
MGELSCISRSERRRQRMTTCMLVSVSSASLPGLRWLVVGTVSCWSSVERVEDADLVMTERDLGGAGGAIDEAEGTLERDKAGRRVAIMREEGKLLSSQREPIGASDHVLETRLFEASSTEHRLALPEFLSTSSL